MQQSRSLGVSGTEIEIDDEDYEEMVNQLEAFKCSSKTEMVLPPGKYYMILKLGGAWGVLIFLLYKRPANNFVVI